MKGWIRVLAVASATLSMPLHAQAPVLPQPVAIAAPPQPAALPLYTKSVAPMPGAQKVENWEQFGDDRVVRNVTVPTMTPYPAKQGTGAAVVVAPGGGFMLLSIENEGHAVAKWLSDHGVTAFVLKYRVMPTPADSKEFSKFGEARLGAMAKPGAERRAPEVFQPSVEDGIAAIRWVREHAAQWNIDPKRVGMVGFSAGAMQALQVSLSAQAESRPSFVGLIYGPLAPATVPSDAPPLFAAMAVDDPLVGAAGFGLIDNWKNAHRPVEFHLYQHGGHGFGMRGKDTAALWPEEYLAWIRANGFLSK